MWWKDDERLSSFPVHARKKPPVRCRTGGVAQEYRAVSVLLDDALGHHGIGDFEEAGDIRAHHEVAGLAILFGRIEALLVNSDHDVLELLIDLFTAPGHSHGVLRHLQPGDGHTTGGEDDADHLKGKYAVRSQMAFRQRNHLPQGLSA